jgi:hypothetical protein
MLANHTQQCHTTVSKRDIGELSETLVVIELDNKRQITVGGLVVCVLSIDNLLACMFAHRLQMLV